MYIDRVIDTLYPIALALANLGAGVALYGTGTPVAPVVLWLSGVLVLAGIASRLGHRMTRSSLAPVMDRS